MMSKVIFSLTLALGCWLLPVTSTQAQDLPSVIAEGQRLSNEAYQLWWKSLTNRQKQLVRYIDQAEDNHYYTYGAVIFPNTGNLNAVMQYVGATRQERNFVLERLQYHCEVQKVIARADDLILNQMPRLMKYLNGHGSWQDYLYGN